MLSIVAVLSCLSCGPLPVAAEQPVDVELVLAVDVSRSMDQEEFALQRAGYVEAIRHPDFIAAVRSGQYGRIAIAYFEWAGTIRKESLVPWQIIDGKESAEAFATALSSRPFGGYQGTSISGAISYGQVLLDENAFPSPRRVIDVSGDGPNNSGLPVTSARDRAIRDGVIINGLPILIRPSPVVSQLDRYYSQCVVGGPGSFVLPIRSSDEFATAIRRKLILEVSQTETKIEPVPIAEQAEDCLQGERLRHLYSDPYFPELDR